MNINWHLEEAHCCFVKFGRLLYAGGFTTCETGTSTGIYYVHALYLVKSESWVNVERFLIRNYIPTERCRAA